MKYQTLYNGATIIIGSIIDAHAGALYLLGCNSDGISNDVLLLTVKKIPYKNIVF